MSMKQRRTLKHPDGTPFSKEERRLHRNKLVRRRAKLGPVPNRARRSVLIGMTPEELRLHRNKLRRERWTRDVNFRKSSKASHKRWETNNPERARLRKRRASYAYNYPGFSWDEYQAKIIVQGGRCGICGTDKPGNKRVKTWHVDHCHKTGEIRKLLCHSCNTGLGHFKDDPSILQRAADYLHSFAKTAKPGR